MSKPERLLYSKSEAADMLGISRKTLLAEVRKGNLRFVRIGARRMFAPSDLEEFIERKRQGWSPEDYRARAIGSPTSLSRVVGFEAARKRAIERFRKS